jgi:hypothetical protein
MDFGRILNTLQAGKKLNKKIKLTKSSGAIEVKGTVKGHAFNFRV